MIKNKTVQKKFSMPIIGYGTGKLVCNNDYKKDLTLKVDKFIDYISLIKNGILSGKIRHIDTAPNYACGLSEKIIGEVMKDVDRNKVFITSKVGKDYLQKTNIIKSVKRSLRRMKIKYLDLCLIHWPNPNTSLEEAIKALLELKEKGLIKNIGVSNFNDVELIKKAQLYSGNQIIVNQIRYNIFYRDHVDVVKYCQLNNIMVVAYRPFEGGYLFSRFFFSLFLTNKEVGLLAIRWLTEQKNVVCLVKSRNSSSLDKSIGYAEKSTSLSIKDKMILNYLFPLELKIRRMKREYINWNYYKINQIKYEI